MLTDTEVMERVKAKGTRFATVTFVKKDGTERKINGLFRAQSHIKGTDGGVNNARMQANGLVPIYSLKDKGWRCFSKDKVVDIR